MKIAVFDLEGTLISRNITFDFAYRCIWHSSKKEWFRLCFFSLISPFYRVSKERLAEALWKVPNLDSRAQKYIKNIPLNGDVSNKVRALIAQGSVILATGAWQPLADAFKEKLGMSEAYGSSPGNILDGEKEKIAEGAAYFFSDNQNDLRAMKLADHPVAVVWDRTQKEWWEKQGIETLYIRPATSLPQWKFWVPLLYSIDRWKGWVRWIMVQGIVLFGFLLGINFWWLLFAWMTYVCFYEIGYLVNDVAGVNLEREPTYRVGAEVRLWPLIVERIAVGSAMIWLLSLFYPVFWFIIGILASQLIFFIHNYFPRIKKRIYILQSFVMFVPLIPFTRFWWFGFITFLLYRLPSGIWGSGWPNINLQREFGLWCWTFGVAIFSILTFDPFFIAIGFYWTLVCTARLLRHMEELKNRIFLKPFPGQA